ncbi:uncharacterized protein LOC131946050 isoform X2 [Physella acuta]|uniref:uncharacterized protein LOC131946050 isoform X2 n=1 Tax=Physella acuta TaxID=109671 RepID=UPI0027DCE86A|nr:uncharacterized protein LOC131946050 isoform X2 [Physella acuta]
MESHVELRKLKKEMLQMKSDMNIKLEEQFLRIKGQIAEIMIELSKQREDIDSIKSNIRTLEKQSLDKDQVDNNLTLSNAAKRVVSSFRKQREGNEQAVSAVKVEQCGADIKFLKTELFEMNQRLKQSSLKQNQQDKNVQDLLNRHRRITERIDTLWVSIHQNSNTQTRIHSKLKRLEKKLNFGFDYGRKLVEEQLADINEKVEENEYDVKQCWEKIDEIEDREGFVMLNGEKRRLDEEIGKLGFGVEALWIDTDDTKEKCAGLKDDLEKLRVDFLTEQITRLQAAVENLQTLFLESDTGKISSETLAADCLKNFQTLWSQARCVPYYDFNTDSDSEISSNNSSK